jgi:hypothetical protein
MKENYIQLLKDRNEARPFKTRLVEMIKEFLKEAGKITIAELIEALLAQYDVKKYWIRDAIYYLIINNEIDFDFVRECLVRPVLEIWLVEKPQLRLVSEEEEEIKEDEPEQQPESEQPVFPVFLSPSVRESAKEQIARLKCWLMADDNNKRASETKMVMSITDSGQLTITYQAETFEGLQAFIASIIGVDK